MTTKGYHLFLFKFRIFLKSLFSSLSTHKTYLCVVPSVCVCGGGAEGSYDVDDTTCVITLELELLDFRQSNPVLPKIITNKFP